MCRQNTKMNVEDGGSHCVLITCLSSTIIIIISSYRILEHIILYFIQYYNNNFHLTLNF